MCDARNVGASAWVSAFTNTCRTGVVVVVVVVVSTPSLVVVVFVVVLAGLINASQSRVHASYSGVFATLDGVRWNTHPRSPIGKAASVSSDTARSSSDTFLSDTCPSFRSALYDGDPSLVISAR
eukprot:29705-Pelagococcus_subviridis.AAC.3